MCVLIAGRDVLWQAVAVCAAEPESDLLWPARARSQRAEWQAVHFRRRIEKQLAADCAPLGHAVREGCAVNLLQHASPDSTSLAGFAHGTLIKVLSRAFIVKR